MPSGVKTFLDFLIISSGAAGYDKPNRNFWAKNETQQILLLLSPHCLTCV